MYNLGKIAFDPGHGNGANVDPKYPWYSEGTSMLALGQRLFKQFSNSILTRTDGKDISLSERAYRAAKAKCNTLISLHSNYPTDGVIVFYSIHRPKDKEIAEYIGKNIAKAIGVYFRGAKTKKSSHGNYDYYGIIRNSIKQGLDHVFIVEHGSHKELAYDTEKKLDAITKTYVEMFGKGGGSVLLKRGMQNADVKELQMNLNKLGFDCGTPDGIFGAKTEAAVKEFQKKYKLTVDGIAGQQTLGKIEELLKQKEAENQQWRVLVNGTQVIVLTGKQKAMDYAYTQKGTVHIVNVATGEKIEVKKEDPTEALTKEIDTLKAQVKDLQNKLTAEQAASQNKTATIDKLNKQIKDLTTKIENAKKALQ